MKNLVLIFMLLGLLGCSNNQSNSYNDYRSFLVMHSSLQKTNSFLVEQNKHLYLEIEVEKALNKAKVKPYWKAAFNLNKQVWEVIDFIDVLKHDIVRLTDEIDDYEEIKKRVNNPSLIVNKNSSDLTNRIMVGSFGSKDKARAYELKLKLEQFKENVFEIFSVNVTSYSRSEAYKKQWDNLGLDTKDPKAEELSEEEQNDPFNRYWEVRNFHNKNTIATLCILTKIQNDLLNAEAIVLNALYSQIYYYDFKFDTLCAQIVAPKNTIVLGQTYTSNIYLAALSTSQDPVIKICEIDTTGGSLRIVGKIDTTSVQIKNGDWIYSVKPNSIGVKKYTGVIEWPSPTGSIYTYPFYGEYTVVK